MKISSYPFILFLILGIAFCSCGDEPKSQIEANTQISADFDIEVAKATVLEKTAHFTEAHISKDTSFLNSIFTDDARVFPPNSEVVSGKKAITQLNTDWVNYGIHEFTEETQTFYGNEEYLIDEGTYYLSYGPDSIIDSGKYINIWKNINGDWKIYSNIWNTTLPFEQTD